MQPERRAQIRLLLDHLTDDHRRRCDEQLQANFTKAAATDGLQNGATIKVAMRTMEEVGRDLITNWVDQVSAVSKAPAAFAMIEEALEKFLLHLSTQRDEAVRLASGPNRPPSITLAADQQFGTLEFRLKRQLALHQFTFIGDPLELKFSTSPATQRNPGGKPLATHWDQMWSAVAVALYNGDLQPKSQADIERFMKDWLVANDLDGGDTAVRNRARSLWTALQAEN